MTLTDIHEINAAMPAVVFNTEAVRARIIEAMPAFIEARDGDALCKLVRDGAAFAFYALASNGAAPLCYVIADNVPCVSLSDALERMAQFWRDEYGGALVAA